MSFVFQVKEPSRSVVISNGTLDARWELDLRMKPKYWRAWNRGSRFSVGFPVHRTNAKCMLQIHDAVHASHVSVPSSTQNFDPNATFTTLWNVLHNASLSTQHSVFLPLLHTQLISVACIAHFCFDLSLPLPEGRTGTIWEPETRQSFCFLPVLEVQLSLCTLWRCMGERRYNPPHS